MIDCRNNSIYIDSNKHNAFLQFTSTMFTLLNEHLNNNYKNIIVLCIGTDRSTGDCLGPLIGYKLGSTMYENVHIFGTLDNPVHAINLVQNIEHIHSNYTSPLIIAIDACLGASKNIGQIIISNSPIKPGAAMNKQLPEVGDISISGIVNVSGFMDFLTLQNTRLNKVMKMADIISSGLRYVLWKNYGDKKSNTGT